MKKLDTKQARELLKNKTILFSNWNAEYKEKYMYQNFYPPIKALFKEVILVDPKKRLIEHGSEKMKEMLIESVKTNKPDFILFTVWGCGDFESMDLIEEFRKASPKSKIVGFYADDDRDFAISSRFYAPLIDYNIVVQPDYTDKYIKEGNRAFSFYVVDTENYKPLKEEKKYDVSFIGSPSPSRLEVLRFLIKNDIKLSIFGRGWIEYPEFKEFYQGELSTEDFNKVLSQTKVNLGFTLNQEGAPHFKARILENGAIKAFTLTDYFKGYADMFGEDKGIVMFKNNEDLAKKIKYYLKNEDKRNAITENAYNKIKKELDVKERLIEIFREIFNEEDDFKPREVPKLKKTSLAITQEEMALSLKDLKEKINKVDYISFKTNESLDHKYKDFFQIYSLEKTKKEISCSSYYIYTNSLGNILRFRPFHAFRDLKNEQINPLLNLDQIMVSKKYFLENLENFKEIFNGKEIDFVSPESSIFIDPPLFRTKDISKENLKAINSLTGKNLTKAFQPNFVLKLYTKMHQKRLLTDPYLYKLLTSSFLRGNTAILNYLHQAIANKGNWDKLKKL